MSKPSDDEIYRAYLETYAKVKSGAKITDEDYLLKNLTMSGTPEKVADEVASAMALAVYDMRFPAAPPRNMANLLHEIGGSRNTSKQCPNCGTKF